MGTASGSVEHWFVWLCAALDEVGLVRLWVHWVTSLGMWTLGAGNEAGSVEHFVMKPALAPSYARFHQSRICKIISKLVNLGTKLKNLGPI